MVNSVNCLRTCNTVFQWKLTFRLLKKLSAFYTLPSLPNSQEPHPKPDESKPQPLNLLYESAF